MRELTGKVAVVTGGGSGIGRALALACAEAGVDVVVADIEAAQAEAVAAEVRAAGRRALAVQTDVSKPESLEALADRAYGEFGAVHLLFNNAGVLFFKPVIEMTPADWQWIFSVNFFGVVHGVAAFLPRMLAQGGGAHIVNTGSMSSLSARAPGTIGYASTKYAVCAYSELLRQELAPEGIGVSLICPAGVRTLIRAAERNRPAELGGPTPLDEQPEWNKDIEQEGRIEPAEVARQTLEAVREDRLYVITHTKSRADIEKRFGHVLADFDAVHGAAAH
jgi:NAD(P)-dependent dehydrogenase (short-subunit alcohol dehydrogenase family)